MSTESISFVGAFLGGIASFLSPCTLPLLPSLVAFFEVEGQKGKMSIKKLLSFWSGFTLVFLSMGSVASLLGKLFFQYQSLLTKMGGIFVIAMGLFLIGFGSKSILQREFRPFLGRQFQGYWGAFFFGIAFTVGWTPCSGPILTAVLAVASVKSSLSGLLLLSAYALGFGVPFLLLTIFFDRFFRHFKGLSAYLPLIQRICGVLLVVIGLLIYSDLLSRWILRFSF